jgi:hypothetical protein
MGTFDVTLPTTKAVIFPPRCVVCEAKNPDGMIKLSFLGIKTTPLLAMATDQALDLAIDPKYYGSNTSNKIEGIPACKGCAAGLKWYHRLLKFAYYTAWIPAMPLFFLPIPQFITITFLIVCAISPGIFTLIYPPSFGASFWDNQANFEFKSQIVAEEFLKLNGDAKLKSKEPPTETNAVSINNAKKKENI